MLADRQSPAEVPFALGERATAIRRRVLQMASGRGEGYVGQGLGVADILAAVFFGDLRYDPARPKAEDRDRFVLSTGHYAIALYAALAEAGILDPSLLASYAADGDTLPASTHHDVPGVESTTGSLAQGLSLACGMALAAKRRGANHRVVVLTSDGEQQEGSTWEAAMFAAHQQLGNLVVLIDVNRTQADGDLGSILEVDPLAAKWSAFGWTVQEVDGNDVVEVHAALLASREQSGQPSAIVCRTRLGAGVPLIENKERTHFVRVTKEEWVLAALELEAAR
jgi:transketolase